jgi:hypothetical protein
MGRITLATMRKNGVSRIKFHPSGEIAEVEFTVERENIAPQEIQQTRVSISPRIPTANPAVNVEQEIAIRAAQRNAALREAEEDLPPLEVDEKDFPEAVVEEVLDERATEANGATDGE